MMDSCIKCSLKGDIITCEKATCTIHRSGYVESLRASLKEKDEALQALQNKLAEAEKKLMEHEESWERVNIGGNM